MKKGDFDSAAILSADVAAPVRDKIFINFLSTINQTCADVGLIRLLGLTIF